MLMQVKNKFASAKKTLFSKLTSAWKWAKYSAVLLTLGAMAAVVVMGDDSSPDVIAQNAAQMDEVSQLAPKHSPRPKMRPARDDVSVLAPKTSLRPKVRPASLMRTWVIDKAIAEAMEE